MQQEQQLNPQVVPGHDHDPQNHHSVETDRDTYSHDIHKPQIDRDTYSHDIDKPLYLQKQLSLPRYYRTKHRRSTTSSYDRRVEPQPLTPKQERDAKMNRLSLLGMPFIGGVVLVIFGALSIADRLGPRPNEIGIPLMAIGCVCVVAAVLAFLLIYFDLCKVPTRVNRTSKITPRSSASSSEYSTSESRRLQRANSNTSSITVASAAFSTNRISAKLRRSPGEVSPSPGEVRPSSGEVRPSIGKVRPSPEEVRPSPGKVSPSPGGVSSSPGKVSPLPLKARPLPGEVSPLPGEVRPSPGKVSPLPGKVSPLPGKVSPLPGKVSPSPGGVSPLPGDVRPSAGSTHPPSIS